jgi:predicted nucleotidyltransferase
LALELEALLGWLVDVVTPEELKPCIRECILRESVPL